MAKINCSDSPICAACRVKNSLIKGIVLASRLLSWLLFANEKKLGYETIRNMMKVAITLKRGLVFSLMGYYNNSNETLKSSTFGCGIKIDKSLHKWVQALLCSCINFGVWYS